MKIVIVAGNHDAAGRLCYGVVPRDSADGMLS
jgi:hypothetical protein